MRTLRSVLVFVSGAGFGIACIMGFDARPINAEQRAIPFLIAALLALNLLYLFLTRPEKKRN
jgi:hypothetical protein